MVLTQLCATHSVQTRRKPQAYGGYAIFKNNKRQHQKESTKVGGSCRAYQGQALAGFEEKFLMFFIF